MAVSTIDNDLISYFRLLDEPQKKSLLDLIKTFLAPTPELQSRTSIEQYNKEIEEAMKRMDEGDFHTQEEVAEMSKGWLHAE